MPNTTSSNQYGANVSKCFGVRRDLYDVATGILSTPPFDVATTPSLCSLLVFLLLCVGVGVWGYQPHTIPN